RWGELLSPRMGAALCRGLFYFPSLPAVFLHNNTGQFRLIFWCVADAADAAVSRQNGGNLVWILLVGDCDGVTALILDGHSRGNQGVSLHTPHLLPVV